MREPRPFAGPQAPRGPWSRAVTAEGGRWAAGGCFHSRRRRWEAEYAFGRPAMRGVVPRHDLGPAEGVAWTAVVMFLETSILFVVIAFAWVSV